MAASVQDILQRAYDNYARLLVLCTEVIANPSQANVDAVVNAASTGNLMRPKITYAVDGENYAWTEYQAMILGQLKALREQIVAAGGPYEVRTIGRV